MSRTEQSVQQGKGSKKKSREARCARLNKRLAAYSTMATGAVTAAAGTSGFMMPTTVEATLLVGTVFPSNVAGSTSTLSLMNAAGTSTFGRIIVGTGPSANSVVFSALGAGGRGFLGTGSQLANYSASDEISLQAPAVGTVTFNSMTNNLPTTGIIGFRTANSQNAVTGLIDFTINFGVSTTVTVNNFWYDANASVDTDGDGFSAAHIAPPVDLPVVPEPATFGLSLLALGAVGVSTLKRKRAAGWPRPASVSESAV